MTLKIYLTTLRNEDKNSQKIGRLKNNWNKFIIVDISPSVVHRFQISIHSECCLLKTAGPIWTKLGTQLPQGSLFAFLVFNGSGAYLGGAPPSLTFFSYVCTCGFPTTGGGVVRKEVEVGHGPPLDVSLDTHLQNVPILPSDEIFMLVGDLTVMVVLCSCYVLLFSFFHKNVFCLM